MLLYYNMESHIISWALEDFNLTYDIIRYMTSQELREHINRPYKCTQLLISQNILLHAILMKSLPLLDNKKVRFSEKNYVYIF